MKKYDNVAVANAITDTFMWSFKKGDNIEYNYEIVWSMYEARDHAKNTSSRSMFNKLMILELTSIIECILEDFSKRTQQSTRDPLPNITPSQLLDFKTKKRDKLEHYISMARKHNIFNSQNNRIYEDLDLLRKMRNRVHIQNSKNELPINESELFTKENLELSQKVFEFVIGRMMTRFYRWGAPKHTPSEMIYPWK